MVDKFSRGRVFVAGGKPTMYLSPYLTYMERPQMQHSMYIILCFQASLTFVSQRSQPNRRPRSEH